MHNLRKRLQLIIAVVVGCVPIASALYAAPPVYVEQQNPYLYVKLGVAGDCSGGAVSGRYAVGTVMGNPESDRDDNVQLIYLGGDTPCSRFGYTTIQIDGADTVFGQSQDAGWTRLPYKLATGWDITGTWTHTKTAISVTANVSIVRDFARFEYIIRNTSPDTPHTVGLRQVGDVVVDGVAGDPSAGCQYAYPYVPGRGILDRETDMVGTEVPMWFDFYNDPVNPTVATRNILREQDATRPDRVAIGEWGNIVSNDWLYNPVPNKLVDDWAWAMWYNPAVMGPGQERRIVIYYGISAASESWTSGTTARHDPFCVALQGPVALKYKAGDIDYGRSDNLKYFEVKGYIYNFYPDITLTNVTADLNLPNGLELYEGQRTQVVNMGPGTKPGEISPQKESTPVVWKVKVTGNVSGPLTYSMSVTGTGGLVKQVARTIIIPATLSTDVALDWQLMTLPFEFKDPLPVRALNFNPNVEQYDLSYWNPALANPGYDAVTVLKPGLGFWFNITKSDATADTVKMILNSDAKALDGKSSYSIDLYPGWNMFGNPFVYPISWGRIKVLNGMQRATLDEAIQNGWIRGIIYWWDPGRQSYVFSADKGEQLVPFRGYWIKSLVQCQLIIPPVDQVCGDISVSSMDIIGRGSTITRAIQPAAGPGTKDNWRLRVMARAGTAVDSANLIGVDTRAADGYDASDIERPPVLRKFVTVSFPHRDWGNSSGSFLQDIRRSVGTQQAWDMEVSTDQLGTDVVLTWPDLVNVPKDVVLKLMDVDGNVTKHMRTTSSYRYNSGSATTRKFKIVAETASPGRLLITGLNVGQSRATGTATVSYALSTDATTDVRVKALSGKTLRSLATGRGMTRGISSLSWNYRTEAGEQVPVGSYLVEVVATTPDGEVAKAVRPFIVAR